MSPQASTIHSLQLTHGQACFICTPPTFLLGLFANPKHHIIISRNISVVTDLLLLYIFIENTYYFSKILVLFFIINFQHNLCSTDNTIKLHNLLNSFQEVLRKFFINSICPNFVLLRQQQLESLIHFLKYVLFGNET